MALHNRAMKKAWQTDTRLHRFKHLVIGIYIAFGGNIYEGQVFGILNLDKTFLFSTSVPFFLIMANDLPGNFGQLFEMAPSFLSLVDVRFPIFGDSK